MNVWEGGVIGPITSQLGDEEPGDPVEHDRADDDVDAALDIEKAGDGRPCAAGKHSHDDADGSMQELGDPAKASQCGIHCTEGVGHGSPVSKERRHDGAYPELSLGADVEQAALECHGDRQACGDVHGTLDEEFGELALPRRSARNEP